MKIQILSADMASRIAAGEVVERPASVVKELIENALDAGATEISVWAEASGVGLLRVVDNGEGMEPDDLSLAVERHSTSKLRDEEGLTRIATLGFRGEALPSIASVSRVEIVSRSRGSEAAYRLRVEGGKKSEPVVAAAPAGTSVEVRDLFFNTPARRKFLKAPATELGHIADVVNRMALAYPAVHFRLFHGGSLLADYVAVATEKERLRQVWGDEIAAGMAPFASARGARAVRGFISTAPASFPNARYMMTFVNRRYVRDRVLTHAVLHGYRTLLMKGRYPAALVFLEIPLEEVDVNVHPAKIEVRFRRQAEVHEVVAGAVEDGLRREAKKPAAAAGAPQAFPAVAETALPYVGSRPPHPGARDSRVAETAPREAEQERGGASERGFFGSMTILGQVLGCYVVCASSRGLALIDQHAAHERVVFERLRRQWKEGAVEKQSLLVPQTLELPAGEGTLLERAVPELSRLGFDLEPFGPGGYAIHAVPALLPEGDYREVVRSMVAELAEVEASAAPAGEIEERLASLACHGVIRAHRKLETAEIRALLDALDGIDFATQCPHGRPVVLELGREELDKMFKRRL
ncbi:MAG TPA: DNA mismatch repair endonuclease MutL [candidate division Zixibacteria bacterium]|nr:DNA mismatch repair endonuclease MutL [candidate division Zixibacteria bacterium]